MIVTRVDGGGDNGENGKCHQETSAKFMWIKPRVVGLRVGSGKVWSEANGEGKMEITAFEKQLQI